MEVLREGARGLSVGRFDGVSARTRQSVHDGRALEDAAAAAGFDDTYAKAHFRRGLALHALGRYREALPELGKARDLEPKNAQVADAIRFAEMRLSRGA